MGVVLTHQRAVRPWTPMKKGRKYSYAEMRLVHKYLPSFCFTERSTDAHRHIAGAHWDLVFKDTSGASKRSGTSTKSNKSAKSESRQSAVSPNSTITRLYDVFYAYLEEHSPELKPVFRSSMHVRGKVLVHISAGMRAMLAAENFMEKVLPLTKTHLRFGVKLEHFNPLGKALMHAMRVVSGSQWNPEIDDAWRRMFCHTSVLLIKAQTRALTTVAKATSSPHAHQITAPHAPTKKKKSVFQAAPTLHDLFPVLKSTRDSVKQTTTTYNTHTSAMSVRLH